jgi:hypothetical protein
MRTIVVVVWMCSASALFAQVPRPPAQTTERREIEVQVVGCVSGDTLTETTLNRTEGRSNSEQSLNSRGRWRLSLTREQREQLRKLSRHQVEVIGVARVSELESGRVVKTARVGKGRVYVGADATKRTVDDEPVALPLLRVGAFRSLEGLCR